MKKHRIGGRVFLALALASAAAAARAEAQEAGIMVGADVPDAVVKTLDGQAVHVADLIRGRPALIEFWATWCPLCKQLEPAMAAAKAQHGSHVTFLSVGVRDNQTAAAQQAYVGERMLAGQFVFDEGGDAVRAFKAPHTSYVVVVSAEGKVVYTGVGGDQDIQAALERLGAGMHTDLRMDTHMNENMDKKMDTHTDKNMERQN